MPRSNHVIVASLVKFSPTKIRLGSWNVGSLTGRLRELVDSAIRRRVNILCVQKTKYVRSLGVCSLLMMWC